MVKNFTKILITAALASALPVLGFAMENKQDVVIDSHNNMVRDNFGGCVRTQWVVDHDKCCKGEHDKSVMHCSLPMVFFDFNKSSLRHDAKDTIYHMYNDALKSKRHISMSLIGHTDTVGTKAYNLHLSKLRAMSVKHEFVKLGVPASEIKIVAKGKAHPMIHTGDGVREERNRRVEIFYEGGE